MASCTEGNRPAYNRSDLSLTWKANLVKRLKTVVTRAVGIASKMPAAVRVACAKTDKKRWLRVSKEIPHWDERNAIIGTLVPEDVSVVDLGAGAQTLRRHLKRSCTYQPCDIIQSSKDVIYCDFNRKRYPVLPRKYDYVVCSGVFEYIRDPSHFISQIHSYGDVIIFTYNPYRPGASKIERLACGWLNHLTERQMGELFTKQRLVWQVLHRKTTTKDVDELIYELRPIQPRLNQRFRDANE